MMAAKLHRLHMYINHDALNALTGTQTLSLAKAADNGGRHHRHRPHQQQQQQRCSRSSKAK